MEKHHLPTYQEVVAAGLLESRRPSMHLRDIVEMYMLNKKSGLDGSMHPAMNANDARIKLDSENHKWVDIEIEEVNLESLYKDVKADEKEFLAAIEYYDANAAPKYKVGINMKATHNMEEVMKAIEEAQLAYDEKSQKGFFAPLRRAFRRLTENDAACKAWLGLMPDESEYFSIICGGIKLILGAARRVREINAEIVNALVAIPRVLNKNRRLVAVHSTSEELKNYASALYVAVLHTMGHILVYYQQRAISKMAKVFLRQGAFEKELSDKIAAITQSSEAIDAEARVLDSERGKETNTAVKQTKQVAVGIYEKTGILQDSVDSVATALSAREVAAIKREAEAKKREDALIESNRQHSEELQEMKQLLKTTLNQVAAIFGESPNLEKMLQDKASPSPTQAPMKRTVKSAVIDTRAERKALMSRLSYEKDIPKIDLQSNLRNAMNLSLDDQNRAVYMMQSDMLQTWLKSTESSVLLVNGGAYDCETYRTPLSFVCAKLSNALRQARKFATNSPIIDLHFFCGEHVDWRDNIDNGPAGVLNSLLAQLLTKYSKFKLSEIKQLKTLEPDDVKSLGRVFGRLIAQLPSPMVVFVIIDSLSIYDDEEREDDAEQLLSKLISLVRKDSEDGCVFKLLVTAPTELRLNAVDDLDEDDEILQIPEGLDNDGGFTDLKWDMGSGRNVSELSTLSIE